MGRPLELTGYKVVSYVTELAWLLRAARPIIAEFADEQGAPVTERDYARFARRMLKLYATLDKAEQLARQVLEVARDNGAISGAEDLEAIAAEIRANLDQLLLEDGGGPAR